MFTKDDLNQLQIMGIAPEMIENQLRIFQTGVPFIRLDRLAQTGDGIICLTDEEVDGYIQYYERAQGVSKMKFVPASGAASRMFSELFKYISFEGNEITPSVEQFIQGIQKFAFYSELDEALANFDLQLLELLDKKQYSKIIECLLLAPGLNYSKMPKGLLKFHKYMGYARTPFEEHIIQAVNYCTAGNNPIHLHFTVSMEHQQYFNRLLESVREKIEKTYHLNLKIDFSVQKPSTDMVALDVLNNNIYRNDDGSLFFRPGGHGALIDNLNELKAEIIFIQNIDNVAHEKHFGPTIRYKKALAGVLLDIRNKIFDLLTELDAHALSVNRAKEILKFITEELFYFPANIPSFNDIQAFSSFFRHILNRPIRVCGMVKNTGEPGGGPFWACNKDSDINLQIIESLQVDMAVNTQHKMFMSATHFNPVDLICSTYNYKGEKFDLLEFVDPNTFFISGKSINGRSLMALERPGLWNGAMSGWISIFIEVPVETFNPVKIINDLLRRQHQ